MAWQSGPVGPVAGTGDQAGVQAYTLQGVMRFLQTEWHRHERDRNAWEIEREEMKKRIAALEGDARTSRGLRLSLEKNVKLLEMALRKERERVRSLAKGSSDGQGAPAPAAVAPDLSRDSKEVAREELAAADKDLPFRGITHLDAELDAASQPVRQEQERDKSKSFLAKSVGEVTYHTLPASHIPPSMNSNHNVGPNHNHGHNQALSLGLANSGQPSLQELQEAYMELQRQKQERDSDNDHHDRYRDQDRDRDRHRQVRSNDSELKQTVPPTILQDSVEAVSHSYEAYGRQVPPPPQAQHQQQQQQQQQLQQHHQQQQQQQQQHQQSQQSQQSQQHQQQPSHHDTKSIADLAQNTGWDFSDSPDPAAERSASSSSSSSSSAAAAAGNSGSALALESAAAGTTAVLPPLRPDMEAFPAAALAPKSPPRAPGARRKSSGGRRRSDGSIRDEILGKANSGAVGSAAGAGGSATDLAQFKIRFAMRGHLDVVRAVIFTGGGSPSEPEFCTASDDGGVKRWHIPASYTHLSASASADDLDRIAHFTHRGHVGAVCSLAACPASSAFSNGGRVPGDGWIFSGGEDATVRVWERGRVDAKAVLHGHKDAVWALCVLPGTTGSILGDRCSHFGGPDRLLLAAGAADGTILIWAVSQPPQQQQQQSSPVSGGGANRGTRGNRRANSISAGSNFPSSPQPSVASNHPFHYSLVHRIERQSSRASPTCISPLSPNGESVVVSYADASVVVFDVRTGEEIVGMASLETYDGTPDTGVNVVVANASASSVTHGHGHGRIRGAVSGGAGGDDDVVHGATGSEDGVEGVVIAGYEDRFIRFFDANSGQCTYTMLAHPAAISALSLSPDGRELVSGGHDASLRFWSLEKRSCVQEITSHRIMRGEGVCALVWSPDGRWVISCGGDGIVKCFSRS